MADMVMSQVTDDMRAWAIRLSREGGEYDTLARLATAREKGEKIGFKKGIAEGEHTAKLQTARNGLKLGLPIEQIQILTGLSLSEIQNL